MQQAEVGTGYTNAKWGWGLGASSYTRRGLTEAPIDAQYQCAVLYKKDVASVVKVFLRTSSSFLDVCSPSVAAISHKDRIYKFVPGCRPRYWEEISAIQPEILLT